MIFFLFFLFFFCGVCLAVSVVPTMFLDNLSFASVIHVVSLYNAWVIFLIC